MTDDPWVDLIARAEQDAFALPEPYAGLARINAELFALEQAHMYAAREIRERRQAYRDKHGIISPSQGTKR